MMFRTKNPGRKMKELGTNQSVFIHPINLFNISTTDSILVTLTINDRIFPKIPQGTKTGK